MTKQIQKQIQAVKELGSVKGVQALSLEEMKATEGGYGDFPWRALKEIYDWVTDKLKPRNPYY